MPRSSLLKKLVKPSSVSTFHGLHCEKRKIGREGIVVVASWNRTRVGEVVGHGEPGATVGDHRAGRGRHALRRRLVVLGRRRRLQRRPGIFASLAALMFNCVNKDEIGNDYYSSYGDDSEWRVKLWLFVAYVVSFVCLAGSVGLLVQDALTDKGPSVWTGVAGVLQCVFVLISGLTYWTCYSED